MTPRQDPPVKRGRPPTVTVREACRIPGCLTVVLWRKLCTRHWNKDRLHGDPLWEPEPEPWVRPTAAQVRDEMERAYATFPRPSGQVTR